MSKNSSAKYYQVNEGKKRKRKKSNNMAVNVAKISQRVKNNIMTLKIILMKNTRML